MIGQSIPTMVVSDFNYIVGPYKKRGDRLFVDEAESREFRDFIHSAGLVDLGFVSLRFI